MMPTLDQFNAQYGDGVDSGYPTDQTTKIIIVKALLKLVNSLSAAAIDYLRGWKGGSVISLVGTNLSSPRPEARRLGMITGSNAATTKSYLRVYDLNRAPVLATDSPIHVFLLPGNTNGAGSNIPLPPEGLELLNGLAIALTLTPSGADSTGVVAGDILVNFEYKV